MKNYRFVLILVAFLALVSVRAQLNSGTVMGLPTGTIAEIGAITGAQEGAIAYATDTSKIYKFNGATWEEIGSTGSSSTYMGAFEISATGTQIITGIPFQPSQISFIAHANIEDLPLIDADSGENNNSNTIANAFGTANGFARDEDSSITQQTIYVGGSGNSIDNISRYASPLHFIGVRYSDQDGESLGYTRASLTSFNADGFTINVDRHDDNILVLYKAYK